MSQLFTNEDFSNILSSADCWLTVPYMSLCGMYQSYTTNRLKCFKHIGETGWLDKVVDTLLIAPKKDEKRSGHKEPQKQYYRAVEDDDDHSL